MHFVYRKDVLPSRCLRVLPAKVSPKKVLCSISKLKGTNQRKEKRVVGKDPVGAKEQLSKRRGQRKGLPSLPKGGRLDFRICGTPSSPLKAKALGQTRAGASKLRCSLEELIQGEELIVPAVFSDKSLSRLNRLHRQRALQKVNRSHKI